MNKPSRSYSRREFARRAALGTAAVATGDWRIAAAKNPPFSDSLQQPETPKLEPRSAAEADTRYQSILQQYGERFSDAQKTDLKRLCVTLQPSLDRLRAYPVANSDQPALYLRPLVERAKGATAAPPKTSSSSPAKPAPSEKP